MFRFLLSYFRVKLLNEELSSDNRPQKNIICYFIIVQESSLSPFNYLQDFYTAVVQLLLVCNKVTFVITFLDDVYFIAGLNFMKQMFATFS